MPSPSHADALRRGACLLVVAALAGCSTQAPPLPADTTAVNRVRSVDAADFSPTDLAADCDEIARQRTANSEAIRAAHAKIAGNSENNQVAGYFAGVLFPPLLLATEGNHPEKNLIVETQARQDTLLKLGGFRNCPD